MPPSKTLTTMRGGGTGAPIVFNNAPFWKANKLFFGLNAFGYVLSVLTPFHYHVDLLGASAFALAAAPGLSANNQRVRWSAGAVVVWSSKLAVYLFYRILERGHDARLDDTLAHPLYAAGFWLYSFAWGALASLPYTVGATSSAVGSKVALRAGAAIFGLGWITETLADYQKYMFKIDHPGQFCDVGLWSVSQHPNWFGNLLIWIGVAVMNVPALVEPVPKTASMWTRLWSYRRVGAALVSPLFMWHLFDGQATGKLLPDSLEAIHKRYNYGQDPKYTNYIDTTPLILPNPFHWFK